MTHHRAYLLVVVAAVSVQSGSAVATTVLGALGATGTLSLRMGFGAVILLCVLRAWRTLPPRGAWPLVALFGGVLGAMNLLFYLAIARIPLGVAVALELIGPLAVAALSSEPSRRGRDLAWTTLAVVGVTVLLGPRVLEALGVEGSGAEHLDLAGVALALAAGACWGGYVVLGTRLSAVMGGAGGLAWAMVCACAVVVPLGIGTAGDALTRPRLLLVGLIVAVLSAALPYALEMHAMRAVGAGTFGVMMATEPVVAAAAGLVIAGQHLTWSSLAGMALVVVAVLGALGRPAAPGTGAAVADVPARVGPAVSTAADPVVEEGAP